MPKLLRLFFFFIQDLYWICDFSQEKAIETPNGNVPLLSGELLKASALTAPTAAFCALLGPRMSKQMDAIAIYHFQGPAARVLQYFLAIS